MILSLATIRSWLLIPAVLLALAVPMGIWLLGRQGSGSSSDAVPAPDEQLVRVQFFDYPVPDLSRLFELEDRLEAAISDAGEGIGELDGDEIALDGSDGYLFFYGSDARRLFETIRPELEASDLMRGAIIMLRFGGPEDEDVRIDTFKLPS